MEQKCRINRLNHESKVFDFMHWDYWALGISGFLLIFSIYTISAKGFNLGIDFTGGTVIEITLKKAVDIDHIREFFRKKRFKKQLLIQNFGSSHDIIMRISPTRDIKENQEFSNLIIKEINAMSEQKVVIKRVEFIGPSVGADLVQTGIMALLIALIFALIYISIRFEWRIATGIVIALVHDVMMTMGVLSFFKIEIDLTIIASLMSVIAYSLNDSIVVSDRIRENFRKILKCNSYEIFNLSLTQTLQRTLITSSTILMIILILYFFGGPVLTDFSLTMLVGVSIGTLSSIYVASTIALKLGTKREHLLREKIE